MTRQELPAPSPNQPPALAKERAAKPARPGKGSKPPSLPLFGSRVLSANAIERIRTDFPGWDIQTLQAEFDAWLGERDERAPRNYEAAFYGFVRRIHAQ
jgi:hypothetical protein